MAHCDTDNMKMSCVSPLVCYPIIYFKVFCKLSPLRFMELSFKAHFLSGEMFDGYDRQAWWNLDY